MAPRKKTTKAPPKAANPPPPRRSPSPEPTPETSRRTGSDFGEYRFLRTADELRNVMGAESDTSLSNSDNESSRNNTNQSRPNFSFLPSHKHSSPTTSKQVVAGPSSSSASARRLASMSTVPNTVLESADSTVAPSTSTGRSTAKNSRKASQSLSSREPSTSSRATVESSLQDENQPSDKESTRSRKQQTPRQLKTLKEIIRLQGTVENLIPRMSFARVIREILCEFSHTSMRVTADMLYCLQEAAEIYLVQLFEDSYRCTVHRDRVTLVPKDMQLACVLRRNFYS